MPAGVKEGKGEGEKHGRRRQRPRPTRSACAGARVLRAKRGAAALE